MAAKRSSPGSPTVAERFRPLAAVAAALICAGLVAPSAASAAPAETEVPAAAGRVAAVFALTVPASSTALISSEELATFTSPTGILTRELGEVIDTPVAIGIDPMILASIRVLGSAAPASAVQWLGRLEGATNETFPLAYADADLTLALQAGSPALLAPTSFDFAVDAGRFAAPTDETPSPTPTDETTPASTVTESPEPQQPEPEPSGPPELPTTESLLAWDYTLPSAVWPVAGSVIGTDLAAIAAGGRTPTILSSGNVQRSVESDASVTIGESRGIVTDDTLSDLFDQAVTATSIETWQPQLVALEASIDAAAARGGAEGATIVVAASRGTLSETARLGATMFAIDNLASVDTVPLSSVAGDTGSPATLVELPQSAERVATTAALLAAESADASFATVAENPLLITGERRLRLLTVLSSAWATLPGGFTTVTGAYLTESAALRESVRVVKSSEITLIADRASLPVTVSNSLGQPVTVNVSVNAQSAVLAVEQTTVAITIEPDSQKRASIPVQSLSNGTAQINVSISSTAGVPIGAPSSVRINVYAGWETPTTVAIGVLVFLVFAFGIARTVVRRKRSKREAAE